MEGQEYQDYQTDYTQDYASDPAANGDGNFEQGGGGGGGGGEYDQSGYEQGQAGGDGANGNPGDKINASKNDDDERRNRASSGQDEDLDRKIFVGGLSWETTVKDLREYFSKFGDVVDCTLKTDQNTGRSRGFGFVMFSDPSTVDKVVSEKSHLLHGRNIDPKRAKARGGREPIKKVFVGGLDPSIPETDIRDHFGMYGKIEEIDLPFDKLKNQRRAFCFITFESEEVVDRVCEKPKQQIGGKEVDVKKATPKPEQRFGGYDQQGGYGGGGYGAQRGGRGGNSGGGQRGRGRGNSTGWGNQGGWGGNQGYDYNNYYNQGYGTGYDYYNQGYGAYPGYDYSNYYQQGWGGYGQGGYGGYGADKQTHDGHDYSGWANYNQAGAPVDQSQGGSADQSSYGKQKAVGGRGGGGGQQGGYHPYQR